MRGSGMSARDTKGYAGGITAGGSRAILNKGTPVPPLQTAQEVSRFQSFKSECARAGQYAPVTPLRPVRTLPSRSLNRQVPADIFPEQLGKCLVEISPDRDKALVAAVVLGE